MGGESELKWVLALAQEWVGELGGESALKWALVLAPEWVLELGGVSAQRLVPELVVGLGGQWECGSVAEWVSTLEVALAAELEETWDEQLATATDTASAVTLGGGSAVRWGEATGTAMAPPKDCGRGRRSSRWVVWWGVGSASAWVGRWVERTGTAWALGWASAWVGRLAAPWVGSWGARSGSSTAGTWACVLVWAWAVGWGLA